MRPHGTDETAECRPYCNPLIALTGRKVGVGPLVM